MGMHAGKYDRLIDLYTISRTQNSDGDFIPTPVEYVTDLPANWKPGAGVEDEETGQRVSSNMVEFRIRYPHSINVDTTMQIKYEGSMYNIVSISESEFGRLEEMVIKSQVKDN